MLVLNIEIFNLQDIFGTKIEAFGLSLNLIYLHKLFFSILQSFVLFFVCKKGEAFGFSFELNVLGILDGVLKTPDARDYVHCQSPSPLPIQV